MTIETMAKREPETTPASAVVDQKVVAELVARASAEGVSLTGEGGLLQQLTKLVLAVAQVSVELTLQRGTIGETWPTAGIAASRILAMGHSSIVWFSYGV